MEATRRRAAPGDGESTDEYAEETVGTRLADEPPAGAAIAFVALGSNLGDRAQSLRAAARALAERDSIRVMGVSGVYESAAHTLPGQSEQPPFLNAVAALSTALEPREVLAVLLAVEESLGRRRDGGRWEARPIDLDLLLYGERVIDEPRLTLPHPRLADRRFVLVPLAELAPALVVPGLGRTVAQLLEACTDANPVVRTELALS